MGLEALTGQRVFTAGVYTLLKDMSEKGCLTVSRRRTAKQLGISESALRTSIAILEKEGLIWVEPDHNGTKILFSKPKASALLIDAEVTKESDSKLRFAKYVHRKVSELWGDTNVHKRATINGWVTPVRLMAEVDNISIKDMALTFDFAIEDTFWRQQIRSTSALRKHYDKIRVKMLNGRKEETAYVYKRG